ncbi:protease inhibitor I42 family protein [candidate division WOR-3 bacterium]|nr:protease inhibitor I42 family protein [candidate division WOR-3 bacterium]
MKKLYFLALFSFLGCSGRKYIVIDSSFDGDTVLARANTSINVVLPSNPSTGYQWFFETDESNNLSLDSSLFSPGTEGLLGSSGEQTFFITLRHDVSARLIFYYLRDWENSSPADSFSFTIIPEKSR